VVNAGEDTSETERRAGRTKERDLKIYEIHGNGGISFYRTYRTVASSWDIRLHEALEARRRTDHDPTPTEFPVAHPGMTKLKGKGGT